MNRKKLFSGCLLVLALCGMALCWLIPIHLWMVIAGCVFGTAVITSFEKQWRQICSRYGRPFIIGEILIDAAVVVVSIWLFRHVDPESRAILLWIWMAWVALRMSEILLLNRDE